MKSPEDNLTNASTDPDWPRVGDRIRLCDNVELSRHFTHWLNKNGIDRRAVATIKSKTSARVWYTFDGARDSHEWCTQFAEFGSIEPA